jgi:hypothetical protein
MDATYTTTLTYPIKEETIIASYVPRCVICEVADIRCVTMPIGTDNAGDYVCPKHMHLLVDPLIDAVKATKKRAGKK